MSEPTPSLKEVPLKELHQIDDLAQARALLHPIRAALLERLRAPRTCAELAKGLEMSAQRINNHLKELLEAGLIRRVEVRAKRNLMESVYQAEARTYWLSPRLAREPGPGHPRGQHALVTACERLQSDAAGLLGTTEPGRVPTIGVTLEISLRDAEERATFERDFHAAMEALAAKYQGSASPDQQYQAMLVCYPDPALWS